MDYWGGGGGGGKGYVGPPSQIIGGAWSPPAPPLPTPMIPPVPEIANIKYREIFSISPAIITDRSKAVLSLRFHLFYVRCCSVFKCFNFNTSMCPII